MQNYPPNQPPFPGHFQPGMSAPPPFHPMMMRPPMMGMGPPPMPPGPAASYQMPLQSASAPVEVGLPNPTLYLQNLPERHNPSKNLPPLLKALFSPYGTIRQVIVKKRLTCHGQAWIIFENLTDAQRALQELQGTRIWGKSVVIRFARFKSDTIAAEEGVLEEEQKRRASDKSICLNYLLLFINCL